MTEKRLRRDLGKWLSEMLTMPSAVVHKEKTLVTRLELCLTISAMLKRINDIDYLLPYLDRNLNPGKATEYEVPEEIVQLAPDSPLGLVLGTHLTGHNAQHQLGVFMAIRNRGFGRWLLLNLPRLFVDLTGEVGPHVLRTSATSWFPGSSQFHLAVPPHAALLRKTETRMPKIEVSLQPVQGEGHKPIRVSGAGKRREANLRQLVKALGMARHNAPSTFQKELDHWGKNGESRRILLIVNSYEQAEWAHDELTRLPQWEDCVVNLLPDDREILNPSALRTREVELFRERDADILVAPLLAIQRGFNILDDLNGALLGSVYFLMRPYPPPDDLTPHILGLNTWTMHQLAQPMGQVLNGNYTGISGVSVLRNRAYREWNRRLSSGQRGLNSLSKAMYSEFLRNQFIVIWQTIGRLLRKERDARVYFVDGAFSDQDGKRNIVIDWYRMLEALMHTPEPKDKFLAETLYQPIWEAFNRAYTKKSIY